ncbi:class I SAM-dependent methyltransferase [Thermodesulfobacteriota bacterium]
MTRENPDILEEQIQYYKARANEYDEWFFRQGRYYQGEDHKQEWFSEIAVMESALNDSLPKGHILELACGTGLWSEKLAPYADKLTVVDSSSETMALCQKRVKAYPVEYIQEDIFRFVPQQQYDFLFFGFWLSHVPSEHFDDFWNRVRSSLKPDGKVFFVDSLFNPESSGKGQKPLNHSGIAERKLNDGREYRVIKIFYEPESLYEKLTTLGWSGFVRASGRFFLFGCLSF